MNDILKRCTFAIISHPDMNKTMTEKSFGMAKVIRETGMVKSKREITLKVTGWS